MKLLNENRAVTAVGVIQPPKQFTIKASGKAFRVLSAGIYKDKILAIVRELSCNAYDAHIASGKHDIPFQVHLPNSLEPYFSIRDTGPSLSPDQINSVFTTYFESTKNEDDDQIGGFGLGCKSPLSYTDSFNVISYLDGIKRKYVVCFDETDTPAMTQLGEDEETLEPTGLEITLAVKNYDFREFKEKAERVFEHFPVLPEITGNSDFSIKTHRTILSGKNYVLEDAAIPARAIMGVVSYPIDQYALSLNRVYSALHQFGAKLYFTIGELDITASREELSYIPSTKERLHARMTEVLNDIHSQVLQKFKACSTEFEARELYNTLFKGVIPTLFPNGIPFKDKIIKTSYFSFVPEDYSGLVINNYNKEKKYTTWAGENQIYANQKLRVFIDDLNGRTAHGRICRYREENKDTRVYLIKPLVADRLNAFLEKLDGVEPIMVSTLPKPEPKGRGPVSALKLSDWGKRSSDFKRHEWMPQVVDAEVGGIYVPTIGGTVQKDGGSFPKFPKFYFEAVSLGLFDYTKEDLYSFPKTLINKYVSENDDTWINFFDHVREKFLEKYVAENWAIEIGKVGSRDKFRESYPSISNHFDVLTKLAVQLDADHPISEFVNLYNSCKTGKDYSLHLAFAKTIGIDMSISTVHDLCQSWSIIDDKYKLIEHMLALPYYYRNAKFFDDLLDYVKTYDKINCVDSPLVVTFP